MVARFIKFNPFNSSELYIGHEQGILEKMIFQDKSLQSSEVFFRGNTTITNIKITQYSGETFILFSDTKGHIFILNEKAQLKVSFQAHSPNP